MAIAQAAWNIENNTRKRVPDYWRDVTLGEDVSQLRVGGGASQANAILNNTVLGLFGLAGVTNVAHARRELEYAFNKQLCELLS